MYRIISDVFIILFVIQGWWFIALPLALLSAWRYSFFIEIVIAGVLYDCLFGLVPDMGIWGYTGTIVTAVSYTALSVFKKIVRK